MDLQKLKDDELALLKKLALQLAAGEVSLLLPLAVSEANKLMPESFLPVVLGLESEYVPKLQEALQKLIQEKLA